MDRTRIEKISGKTSNACDRVIHTLVHWWKKVQKNPQAIQSLAYALSQLDLEKLAGRVLIGKIKLQWRCTLRGKCTQTKIEHVLCPISKLSTLKKKIS